ncbi:MAG: hypothetical protein ACM3OH_04285 [Bacillota bacterium]
MKTPRLSDERGIALAVAVLALVVIGALVAGSFYAGRVEQRSGQNTLYAAQAFEAADAGASAALSTWSPTALNSRPIGADTVLPTVTSLGGGNAYTPTITRLSSNTFMVRAEGVHQDAAGNTLSRRVVGMLVRIVRPNINIQGALTIGGALTLGGSAEVDGNDHLPTGWGGVCPLASPAVAGIRTNTTDIHTNGSNCNGNPPACVTGSPPVQLDTTVTPSTFTQFGATSFDDLAAAATWTVSGTLSNIGPTLTTGTPQVCQTSNMLNWGEPYGGVGSVLQCFDYFPIIYAPSNLRISGGRGQGILLVRGDLDLSGGVEFYGPVIVLGNLTSTGTGGHVYGGVMASNADLDPTVITGNSVVNYSACSVQRALQGAAVPRPFGERSWSQLY